MKIKKMLGDYVLIRMDDPDELSKGGIFIPEKARKPTHKSGVVVDVGPGRRTREGQLKETIVKVGDNVILSPNRTDTEIELDGVDHMIVRETRILAIVD